MGERLRDVLAAHEGAFCICGELTTDPDAHVEAAVLAWLGERLGDAAVVEAVAEAVAVTFGGWHGPDPEGFGDDWTAEATAALAAVRALVTETSNEGDE